MIIIDLKQDSSNENKYFSNTLISKIEKYLKDKKKVILYLNKRWDYSSLICNKCSKIYKCDNCDIPLSIHDNYLVCHICNYTKILPNSCEICKNSKLQKIWIWTWQIEKFIKQKWPDKLTYRFDTDVIKNKVEKKEALERLQTADIVIWTKMITTWFDFNNVWLVWIVLLEQELQIPKYNTTEMLYSNLKQFIWRGWRKWEKTEFIVQSFIPENPVVNDILYSNYKEYLKITLEERKKFNYPPFSEFASLEYRDKDKDASKTYIIELKQKLENKNTNKDIEIIWYPIPFKKQWLYHTKIIIKWNNIRDLLYLFKKDIFWNSNLSLIFD